MKFYHITKKGHAKMQELLHKLKTHDRPETIKALQESRAHGDLKENGEFKAAKERQGFIEGRILELESKISSAKIVELHDIDKKIVQFGASVKLTDTETERKTQYTIVSEEEADFQNRKISIETPVARALVGKKMGEIAEVNLPNGEIRYFRVDSISYEELE